MKTSPCAWAWATSCVSRGCPQKSEILGTWPVDVELSWNCLFSMCLGQVCHLFSGGPSLPLLCMSTEHILRLAYYKNGLIPLRNASWYRRSLGNDTLWCANEQVVLKILRLDVLATALTMSVIRCSSMIGRHWCTSNRLENKHSGKRAFLLAGKNQMFYAS